MKVKIVGQRSTQGETAMNHVLSSDFVVFYPALKYRSEVGVKIKGRGQGRGQGPSQICGT